MGSKINPSRFYNVAKSQLHSWMPTRHLTEDKRVELAIGDKRNLILSVFFQLVVVVGSGFLWWYLGGSIRPMIGGVCAGVVMGGFMDLISFARLTDRNQVQRFGWFWHVNWLGYVALVLVTSGLTGLVGRVWTGAIILVQILIWLIGMLSHWLAVKRNPDFFTQSSSETNTIKWFGVCCGVVFVPFIFAWSVASLPWWNSNLSPNTVRAWLDKERSESPARLKARIDPNRCRWTHRGQPIRVAVTLSGGGYRAAIIHAGLLAALDAHCVPIHILSTVSGGSIIGAAYDAGVPPSTFASKLASQVPGLPTEVMNIFSALAHLAFNWGTITETYRDHFGQTFFGELLLGELPDAPLLLVNATDLEAGAQEAREVFFKNRAPAAEVDGKPLDRFLRVAEIVAASGAFPGAFLPEALHWVEAGIPADGAMKVKKRQFTDGGVAENLGVEGLRRYLTLRDQDGELPPRVHVLIISDADRTILLPEPTP
jgi:predicted acylesterase/phospholipase RssA